MEHFGTRTQKTSQEGAFCVKIVRLGRLLQRLAAGKGMPRWVGTLFEESPVSLEKNLVLVSLRSPEPSAVPKDSKRSAAAKLKQCCEFERLQPVEPSKMMCL